MVDTELYGYAQGQSSLYGPDPGVWGDSGGETGVIGSTDAGIGVWAWAATGTALLVTRGIGAGFAAEISGQLFTHGIVSKYIDTVFDSNVTVRGMLTKSQGQFRIDHPLDPANKYLSHSFVESPEMKNVYDGLVELNWQGEAVVEMPNWFEALNREYRYQLTAVGAAGPGLHVAQELRGNRFKIAGGAPGLKVSWQVTGIRQDAYAAAHHIKVEEEKVGEERGKYLHPVEHGMPEWMGIESGAPMLNKGPHTSGYPQTSI
jgi:hypothetical protein